MSTSSAPLTRLDRPLVLAGFKELVPLSFFVTVFGAAFGLAATQVGLDGFSAVLMSTLVFAGAAQFAALELWSAEIPLLAILLTVFAINARHLLMGASLYPWLSELPPAKRYGIMVVASDANWAMALQSFQRNQPGLGLLFGGGLALWSFWIAGTLIGLYSGNALAHPQRLGLDMVMGCFLLTMVLGGKKDSRTVVIWAVAAVSSLLAFRFLPENSHVIVGALSGGLAGVLLGGARHVD